MRFRNLYATMLLITFFGWLSGVVFKILPMITTEKLDPMMSLVAGLGIGGVTNALLVLITLTVQFYFRKANAEEMPK